MPPLSALKTWAQAAGAKKRPEDVKLPLPKAAPSGSKPAEKKEKQKPSPRVWHDDHAAHGLPKETWHDHYEATGKHPETGKASAHPDHGGTPSKARTDNIHKPIIADFFRGKKPAGKDEKKIAIMTMGAPASGKSSGLRNVDLSKFVAVDPDDIKGRLPEYKKATGDRNKTYKGAAAMAHEESSHIAKMIAKKAIDDGHHVLIDGTGANKESFIKKMKQLKDKGYHVHVSMSHLDADEGLARAKARADDVGRHVPDKFVKDAYKTVPKNFLDISKHADTFKVSDNRGKGGRTVWSKDEDGEHPHDPFFVANFKKNHG